MVGTTVNVNVFIKWAISEVGSLVARTSSEWRKYSVVAGPTHYHHEARSAEVQKLIDEQIAAHLSGM